MLIDDLQVGCAVRVLRAFPAISVLQGEMGWVYETYKLGNHRGVSVIFERGGYDGFGEDNVDDLLENLHVYKLSYGSYKFSNVMQVDLDYKRGFWNFKL